MTKDIQAWSNGSQLGGIPERAGHQDVQSPQPPPPPPPRLPLPRLPPGLLPRLPLCLRPRKRLRQLTLLSVLFFLCLLVYTALAVAQACLGRLLTRRQGVTGVSLNFSRGAALEQVGSLKQEELSRIYVLERCARRHRGLRYQVPKPI